MRRTKLTARRRAAIAGALAVAALANGAGPVLADGPAASGGDDADRIPNRYVVVLKGGTSLDELHAVEADATAHDGKVHVEYTDALRGFGVTMSRAALSAVQEDAAVRFVEPDRTVDIAATQVSPPSWGLDRVDQRPATLDNRYGSSATGAGVVVYAIDTGIRATHTEFGGRVASGYSGVSDGRGTSDCNGHGTHTAATIGGATYGVAKQVTLVPVRVLNCAGSGSVMQLIEGIDWVTQQVHDYHQAHPGEGSFVANMSLGQDGSSAIDQAVNSSIAEGITYVVAAGNESGNACTPSPAGVAAAITVGATAKDDSRASFSNYGTCVDVWAPGVDIRSAWASSDTDARTESGTSMATPHVAGAAALYLERFPAASPAEVSDAIRATATTNVLRNLGAGSTNRLLNAAALGGVPNRGPTSGTPVPLLTGGQSTSAGAVPVKISTAEPIDPEGDAVAATEFQMSRDGGATWSDVASGMRATTATVQVAPARALRFRARATDQRGNVGDWSYSATRTLRLHDQDSGATYSRKGHWRTSRPAAALGGSVRRTNRGGAALLISFRGSQVVWIATMARDRGKATVYIDGRKITVIDLYSRASTNRRSVFYAHGLSLGSHQLKIVVDGRARSAAKGHGVDVDGWATLT